MKKYELTDETKVFEGETLYRIKALRDFGDVNAGDLGGWIRHEDNLSHAGNCWVFEDGVVSDNAKVMDNAEVSGNAVVRDNANVMGNAEVSGNAVVRDNANVMGNAKVMGNAVVRDNANVMGNAKVMDNAEVMGNSVVRDRGVVRDHGLVRGDGVVKGDGVVRDRGVVRGNQILTGKAFTIGGLLWHVTIGDDFINVGCVSLTHGELLSMTKKKLPEIEGALEFWERYGRMLRLAVKNYRGEK